MSANKSQIGGGKYKQGYYVPINKDKYIGNVNDIKYRSSWEKIFCFFLDNNKNVLKWACESPVITYTNLNGKISRYYPDFYYELKTIDDNLIKKVVVEIKPKSELLPPKKPLNETAKSLENYEYSLRQHIKNKLKWSFAEAYCKKRYMEFIIITEDHLKKANLLK